MCDGSVDELCGIKPAFPQWCVDRRKQKKSQAARSGEHEKCARISLPSPAAKSAIDGGNDGPHFAEQNDVTLQQL